MAHYNNLTLPNGQIHKELILPKDTSMTYSKPLQSKRNMIVKTKAMRVGGGYILSKYERPIPEDPERIEFLRACIALASKSKSDLEARIIQLLDSNIGLNDLVYNKLDKECYESSLLQNQKHYLEIQKLTILKDSLESKLTFKNNELAGIKEKSERTIKSLVGSLDKVGLELTCKSDRAHSLANFDSLGKPLLAIKIQNLMDEIQELENLNTAEILKVETLNKVRIVREKKDFENVKDALLKTTVDKTVSCYPDRLIRELYLNNRMKIEKDKFNKEIAFLIEEIQSLNDKIGKLPKTTFEDRSKSTSLDFNTKIDEDEEITFDFERRVHLPI